MIACWQRSHPLGRPFSRTAPAYEGGGEMLLPDVEDRELLTALARATCAALPEKKPRKKPMKKE